jgi:hypothetical protein
MCRPLGAPWLGPENLDLGETSEARWLADLQPEVMVTVDVIIHVPIGNRSPSPSSVENFYRTSGRTEAAMSAILPGSLIPTEPVVYTISIDEVQGE